MYIEITLSNLEINAIEAKIVQEQLINIADYYNTSCD